MVNWTMGQVIVTVILALCAIGTLTYTSLPGSVEPINASSYAIFRGMGQFNSDHIVVPIEWKNFGGQPALVMQPKLTLKFKNGTIVNYELAGEFNSRSPDETGYVGESFILKQAFVVDPHSITPTILVFHVVNWYDENKSFTFRNEAGEITSVNIKYYYISYWDLLKTRESNETTKFLMNITFRDWVKEIKVNGDWRWDMDATELAKNEDSWFPFTLPSHLLISVLILVSIIILIIALYVRYSEELDRLKHERDGLRKDLEHSENINKLKDDEISFLRCRFCQHYEKSASIEPSADEEKEG